MSFEERYEKEQEKRRERERKEQQRLLDAEGASEAEEEEERPFTLCWVGFVFCSPTLPSTGTRETWTNKKFSRPTLNWNCLKASRNTIDSISPTVPPTSIKHTSGVLLEPSTGFLAISSILR